jgi:hypothetical protein
VRLDGRPGGVRPFALGIGRVVPGTASSASGILDLDIYGCGFALVFNGFDPTSPLSAISYLAPAATPTFSLNFVYSQGTFIPAGVQAVVADPSSPAGVTLSAAADFFPGPFVLTGVAPSTGTQGGGTAVTITGSGFVCGPTQVRFGTVAAGNVSVFSQNTIFCIAPPQGATGAVDVTVTQEGSTVILPQAFTYTVGSQVLSVTETFNDSSAQDHSHQPLFADARWDDASATGRLAGVELVGSPLAPFMGNPSALGTRTQVTLPIGPGTTLPLTTGIGGLFSPFDDVTDNLGPNINPQGGSHIMHLFEATDLGSPRASLELVEWGPHNNVVFPSDYPQYRAWGGMTSTTAPIACQAGNGLNSLYRANYSLPTPQPPDPQNLSFVNPAYGGVLLTAPRTYSAGPGFTSYYPFPVFDRPFDFLGSGPGAGNLLLEQNIEPGLQSANFNRFRATAPAPVRRLIGGPRSSGNLTSTAGGCDIYDMRFTFVTLESSARSLFYDTGIGPGLTPVFVSLILDPDPAAQPAGTRSRWNVQGATGIIGPGIPAGVPTPWLTYWNGDPLSGTYNSLVITNPGLPSAPQLSGRRYFRFEAVLRGNHMTNEVPAYDSVTALVTF